MFRRKYYLYLDVPEYGILVKSLNVNYTRRVEISPNIVCIKLKGSQLFFNLVCNLRFVTFKECI